MDHQSTPLYAYSLTRLSQAFAQDGLTVSAAVEALYARHDAVDAKLGGYRVLRRADAIAEAAAADDRRSRGKSLGTLDGLPLSIKDNFDLAGTASTLGLRARRDHRANADAELVRWLRERGMVVLGKSRVPQTLMAIETVNWEQGRSCNPWNHERTPGGSSGGEAVLVASGQSPLGLGSDVGGSVRIPAAYCGLVGLKPTRGRWSRRGMASALPGQEFVHATPGPIAREAADIAWLMRQLAHGEPQRDVDVPPVPWPTAADPLVPKRDSLVGLRIGFYTNDGDVAPSDCVLRAVASARDALADAGAELVPFPPSDAADHYPLYVAGLTADGLHTPMSMLAGERLVDPIRRNVRLARLPRALRRAFANLLEASGAAQTARSLRQLGKKSVAEYWSLCARRQALRQRELARWRAQRVSALLSPVTATAAPKHGQTADMTAAIVYTARYNLIDLPAIAVPVTTVPAVAAGFAR